MQKEKLLDEIIDSYINKKIPDIQEEENTEDIRNLLKKQILSDVTEVIISNEKDKIVQQAELDIDKKKQDKKRQEMKIVVIETLFLGFLIGLLANQGTDLITYIKGGNVNVGQTLMWIILLILANLSFGLLMYMNKLDGFFYKK
nr:hypothetical protein [uncultured Romboutsia sp.]